MAWLALPPWADLNLNPLHAAGLWLDVITTPPAAPLCTTWWLTTGVGAGSLHSLTAMPLPAITEATVSANSREANRVSYPTTNPSLAVPSTRR